MILHDMISYNLFQCNKILDMRTFTLSYESYLQNCALLLLFANELSQNLTSKIILFIYVYWTYSCLFVFICYTDQVLRYIRCSAIIPVRPIYIFAPKEPISFYEQSLVAIQSLMGICVAYCMCL